MAGVIIVPEDDVDREYTGTVIETELMENMAGNSILDNAIKYSSTFVFFAICEMTMDINICRTSI